VRLKERKKIVAVARRTVQVRDRGEVNSLRDGRWRQTGWVLGGGKEPVSTNKRSHKKERLIGETSNGKEKEK